MKKKYAGDESENEFSVDEPEELQGSDDDWTPAAGDAQGGRRTSKRLRTSVTKKPRLADPSSSEEEEEEEGDTASDEDSEESEEEFSKNKGKKPIGPKGRGRGKKAQVSSTSPPGGKAKSKAETVSCEATSTTINSAAAAAAPPVPIEKEFTSGAFVVLKTDFKGDGDPPIWKIDGKALLQKYMPFEQDGKTLYKNTSTYSGWSINNKDLYYPAPIVFKMQNRKETIVEFLKDSIKDVKPAPAEVESESPHRDESGEDDE